MKNFSKTVQSITASDIKKVELLAKEDENVISFAQGIPSFFTAPHIKNAVKDAMDKNLTDKYTSGFGIDALRIAMATKVKKDNNISVTKSNILVTHGSTEAMMATLLTLLDPGDEVIMPTPNYASHIMQTRIATLGREPIFVPMREEKNDWTLDIERLEKAVTKKTKAIIICNPSNPIGKVYKEAELKEIAKLAIKHDLYIIVDEMYEYFVFEGTHISIGSFKEIEDRVITLFGVSKSYAMTGWRIGYVCADSKIIDAIYKIHDSLVNCPSAISQYAALAAITGPQDVVESYKAGFLKRRQIVIDELSKTDKLELIIPRATYYALPRVRKEIDDRKLAEELVKEAKVALVPGSAFGKGGENHLRISFGLEEDKLKEGMKRLVKYFNSQ